MRKGACVPGRYGDFPKVRGTLFWGALIIRILPLRVLYEGPPIFGNPHMSNERKTALKGALD